MKTRVIVTAAVLFAGLAAPSFAFEGVRGMRTQKLVTPVSCDIRAEDEQALCAANCDDVYIRGKQHNMTDQAKNEAQKKACDAKCGCPQNTQ